MVEDLGAEPVQQGFFIGAPKLKVAQGIVDAKGNIPVLPIDGSLPANRAQLGL